MDSKRVLEKILLLSQFSKNYVDLLSQNSFDLENKVLFYICLNSGCGPQDLIDFYKIKKTNLAILCKKLLDEKLIEKEKNTIDARTISYKATETGKEKFDKFKECFSEKLSRNSEVETEEFLKQADAVIKFLKK